jgi:hypothetical protein
MAHPDRTHLPRLDSGLLQSSQEVVVLEEAPFEPLVEEADSIEDTLRRDPEAAVESVRLQGRGNT